MKKSLILFAVLSLILMGAYALTSTAQQQSLPQVGHYAHKITFKVADVKPSTSLLEESSYQELIHQRFVEHPMMAAEYDDEGNKRPGEIPIRSIECFARDRRNLVGVRKNGFYEAIYTAYSDHRPLVISPDMIWLVIAQGFAQHINLNADSLRHHFVKHEGKKPLVVRLDEHQRGFVLGRDDNDWEWAFQKFNQQIADNTSPELANLVAGRFSGTNTDAAVAFDITLMDAMQGYFDYWGQILCGIPEITLEGTPEDWKQIETRCNQLAKYGLEDWVTDLKPILREFTKTSEGQVNTDFWAGIMKYLRQPAGCTVDEYLTGWVLKLFPYIEQQGKLVKNPTIGLDMASAFKYLPEGQTQTGDYDDPNSFTVSGDTTNRSVQYTGPKVQGSDIPEGISTAILNIDNNGDLHKMELKAGFFGYRQDQKTFALRPEIGWAIIETGEKPDPEVQDRYLKKQ